MAPTTVFVLGMHRSGTSLLARLLNFIGVDLGPSDRFDPPSPWNPTGYWEHTELRDINDDLLARLGGDWRRTPALPISAQDGDDLDDLRSRAAEIIERDFGAADTWGFKDPRTCLTLPFWEELVPRMRCVLCVRHPLGVADSLVHGSAPSYDGFDRAEGLALWARYVAASVVGSAGHTRTVVWYDDVLRDPTGELSRLAREVGIRRGGLSAKAMSAAEAFVQPELRHHRPPSAKDDAELPTATRNLLVALRAPDADWASLNRLAERLLDLQGAPTP